MSDRYALTCPCSCHGRGSYAPCDEPYSEGCGYLHGRTETTGQDRRTATNGTCPGCGAAVADNALCGACTARFRSDLAQVPFVARELEVLRAKLARIGADNTSGPSSEIPLGYRPFAAEVADVLHLTLTVWARNIAQADGVPLLDVPAESPVGLAWWLDCQVEVVRRHPAAVQLLDEVAYAVRVARRTIDRPADRAYLGECDECKKDLYAGPRVEQVVCECGSTYQVEARRTSLLAALCEHNATAGEIAAGIGDLHGQPINRKTISKWFQRERLHEAGRTREGWPLFRVGDVLALASGQATATRRAAV